jgi:hypothetical protein
VIRMIADSMSLTYYLIYELGIPGSGTTNNKKSYFSFIFFQQLEDFGCKDGIRAIVKGQGNYFFTGFTATYNGKIITKFWKKRRCHAHYEEEDQRQYAKHRVYEKKAKSYHKGCCSQFESKREKIVFFFLFAHGIE